MINSIIEQDMEFITKSDIPWCEFDGKSVLVTGANGFLPAYMVKALMHLNKNGLNIRVIGLVRNEKHANQVFQEFMDDKNFTLLVQDVCVPINISGKLDYIVHAASPASPKHFGADPVGTINANVLGTSNCLKLAREKDVKSFLFLSSGSVYGVVSADKIPIKEDEYGYINPLETSYCYGESKKTAEAMCSAWFNQYGIPVKMVRPNHIYGPGVKLDDGRVFADFIGDILNSNDIILKSEGKETRSFCYLADATRAFFTVLLKGVNNNAYNVSNMDCEMSISDLAHLLVGLFPDKNLKVVKNIDSNNYSRPGIPRGCLDTEKLSALGWKPHFGIEEGFKRTIQSFMEAKITNELD